MRKLICRRPSSSKALSSLAAEMPEILRRVYAARGIDTLDQLDYRLTQLSKPDSLRGVQAALALLEQALYEQQSILVVGDFDADGATSTALAVQCLRAFGYRHVDFLVPNRFEYGYGLTPEIVAVAAERSPNLIITVDNGISSLAGVAAARERGIAVLVTDHHLPGKQLPDADAIVNPNQPACDFPSKNLAGVGVIFYLMSALRSHLRSRNQFGSSGQEPNLAEYLDLVALGTVADVVPLDHNNRVLVSQGLQRMRAGKLCPGIRALLHVAGRSLAHLTAADLGFAVGPRLNAAGRLDDMSLGIRCLLATSEAEAFELAQQLNDLNADRRQIEAGMQAEALKVLEQLQLGSDAGLPGGVVLYQPGWHQGVIGILASRIKDRLHRPVIAFAETDGGTELKGSGRSITGIHLRDTLNIIATRNPTILSKFGGHAMAAGLSIAPQDLPRFTQLFDEAVVEQLGEESLRAEIWTDGNLEPGDFTLATACAIRRGGPWGQHFPEPLFDGEFVVLQQRILAGNHLKLRVAPTAGVPPLDAIAFNADISRWPGERAKRIHAVFKLDVNDYRGQQSVQLLVEHFEVL